MIIKRFSTLFVLSLVFISLMHGISEAQGQDEADWMPDANLRTAVRSALNIDAGDTLIQADMENLTELAAKNSEISNITGLDHATNLETLDLRDNTISNINALSGLTSLETLRLKGNNIDNISALSGLTHLLLLNLRKTGISSVSALSGLTNLAHLRLDGNSITDVQPLTSLVNLEKLWIAGNSLTNAHLLSSLTNLTTIDITIPDPPDTTAPDVSISVPFGTQNSTFDVTITFNESVSGFEQSELDVSGDANASITSWSPNADNTVFTAEITPTTSGTVTLDIAADVATDAANNGNTAATTQSVTVEIIPDAATWMPDANLRSAVRSALGLAANEAFSRDDLATLTSLDAPQRQISNLTGLEFATGLTTLVAWQNGVTSLEPIQDLTALTDIRIGNNDIRDLQPLAGLTALTHLGLQRNNISDVSALSGLVNLTWLRLAHNPVTDFSPLVTLVNVMDSDVDLPEPDTTAPSVSIDVPSDTQTGAFDAIITFSESVSNFVQDDVRLSGTATASITNWLTNAEEKIYTATITPTTSGTVTLDIAADVATDAAGNNNTAATSQSVTVQTDTTAPDVSISVPSGAQNGAFDVIITFTEVVSDFVQADLSLGGTATASITDWSTTDNTVFTAEITPTTSGTVTLDIAADVANNGNTSATTQTVTLDIDAPTVVIDVPSGKQNGAFEVTITFTEAVSGFDQSDLRFPYSSAGGTVTSWNANADSTVYTATITPTQITGSYMQIFVPAVVATDAAGNPNTESATKIVSMDMIAPEVRIDVPATVQIGAFEVTITFTEAVSDFEQSDLQLSGTATASITSWSANTENSVYTATITPLVSGELSFSVPAGVATDEAGNANTAATSNTVTIPEVSSADTIQPRVSFSLDLETYHRSSSFYFRYVTNGVFEVTITFTEPVSGFDQSDVKLDETGDRDDVEATITDFQTIDAETYIVEITPFTEYSRDDDVRIEIPAGAATDAAGNPNVLAHTGYIEIDVNAPPVQISVPTSVVEMETFEVSFYFGHESYDVPLGFDSSDVSLTNNTAGATITDWYEDPRYDRTLIAEITATQSGSVTFSVPEGIATDLAGNPNTAAVQRTVAITLPGSTSIDVPDDITPPGVSISVPSGVQTGPFEATITFTEAVSGFVPSDMQVPETSSARITAWNTTDNTIYTATITPWNSGSVTLNVPAGVATDGGNNQNIASTSQTVTVSIDRMDAPESWIDVPATAQIGAFEITIKFLERISSFSTRPVSVADFEQSDLQLSGTATASITSWSANTENSVYTATITPLTSGELYFSVPAGVATDEAGNANAAAFSNTVTIPEVSSADTIQPRVSFSLDLETYHRSSSFYFRYVTNGVFEVTITFTEPVSGFDQSDVKLDETGDRDDVEATITDFQTIDAETYTVEITPFTEYSRDDDVRIEIPAGAATDAAGNPNVLAHTGYIEIDVNAPPVQISVPTSVVEMETFEVSFYFGHESYDVPLGFDSSDVSLTNNTAGATITDWYEDPRYGRTLIAEITATQSGSVTFSVPEGVATDLAGNPNTAAVQKTVAITFPDPATWMPDANLRAAVRTALNLQTNAAFTQTSMLSLTSLSAANQRIADVTGLEYATNLTTLVLNGNAISDVSPLANLSNLTTLRLAGNPILDTSALYPLTLSNLTDVDIAISLYPSWDVNEDGNVDAADITLVTLALGQSGDGIVNPRTDVNSDDTVDIADLLLVTNNLDTNGDAPSSSGLLTLLDPTTLEKLDPATLEAQLEILRAKSDGSLKYLRAIAVLESVLAEMRPDKTQLLANYPNPFNPETWIPYHLANPSDVQITIYDVRGTIIHRLDLGHQQEGYYTSRGRAAYWDGRNTIGERVASGIYFYQFQADNRSLLRKMLILK